MQPNVSVFAQVAVTLHGVRILLHVFYILIRKAKTVMLLKFFLTCNKIGAFTLGGGYAMIPIMEKEFVDNNKWMDKQEFMDIMVVAQTTPGIFAIDMASHIGYKLRGVWGGIVGAIGIALPSIIAILVLSLIHI